MIRFSIAACLALTADALQIASDVAAGLSRKLS